MIGIKIEQFMTDIKIMNRRFYKLNGKVFLLNTENVVTPVEGYDLYYATDGENIRLFELMDITTEIENGQSYSIYIDSLEYLIEPTVEEVTEANHFLDSLFKDLIDSKVKEFRSDVL